MSTGFGVTTFLDCLRSGEPIMGVQPSNWFATVQGDQEYFAGNQMQWRAGLDLFGDTLRSFAHFDPILVRQKASEWAMQVQLPAQIPSNGLLMISQYKEMMEWLVKGERVDSRFAYPTFWLKKGVGLYLSAHVKEPVVAIQTNSRTKDVVYVTRWNDGVGGSIELLKLIEKIHGSLTPYYREFDGVQIPCVHADIAVDLSWALGLTNSGWVVAWAAQKILFGMNQVGFAVREESAVLTMRGPAPRSEPYVVSPSGESFLFWRMRPGVSYPISMFQFTKDNFKDPGDLNKIVS